MPIPVEEMWRLQRSGGYTKGKEIEDFSKSKNRKVQMEGPYEQLLVCAWRRMQIRFWVKLSISWSRKNIYSLWLH